jgi:hypothetical protein
MAQSSFSPAQRARLVAGWRASDLTQSAFARRRGIHPRTFWGWSHDGLAPAKPRAPRFVSVRVAEDTPAVHGAGGLEIVVPGGVRIHVAPGAEPTWVAAVLAGLQTSC